MPTQQATHTSLPAIRQRLESAEVHRCIELCGRCAAICERTSAHCLMMGGDHAAVEHQTLLRDCASICSTAACFMARGSERHAEVCRLCAEICEACASDCERLVRGQGADGDAMMSHCAETCRFCADSCRMMVARN